MTVEAWTLIPFCIMLLVIAVAPLVAGRLWEKNVVKLAVTLLVAGPTAIYLVAVGMGHNLMCQILGDYVPFIILLLSLYVVTGGIQIKGDVIATPFVNVVILIIGFVLASFMGTTGAAMLLIRPLLEFNRKRENKTHTVLFFIAMVANCGGILSPLGDPPLFLLYLRGAPFTWFAGLFSPWLFAGMILVTLFLLIDNYMFAKEPLSVRKQTISSSKPIRVKGRLNIIWLGIIILSVVFLNERYIPMMGEDDCPVVIKYIREIVMLAVVMLSLYTTRSSVREANNFSWDPILEVAILFVGIFTTMTPALMYLNQHASSLGLTHPWQFYYSTGLLSAFLDNSPTAVAFHSVASGLDAGLFAGAPYVAGIPEVLLKAVSLGAVFFGSLTYIGNGPNFMVKAIAEKEGVHMPSFFGYMAKFSLVILLPVYILAQLLFL